MDLNICIFPPGIGLLLERNCLFRDAEEEKEGEDPPLPQFGLVKYLVKRSMINADQATRPRARKDSATRPTA